MYTREEVILSRDVGAIQIPDGTPIQLLEGETVWITQQLGGSYTVVNERGGLFRIDERNGDAIGKSAHDDPAALEEGPLEDRVWDQMRKCFDPEIPVNIVDLGLVYNCQLTPLSSDEGNEPGHVSVEVKMTLTAPGCGMGPVIAKDVKDRIEALREVDEAEVEVVFDPPWSQQMMTEAAKLQLGFF